MVKLLVILMLVAVPLLWVYGEEIVRLLDREPERVEATMGAISPEMADGAAAKLERLREENEPVRLSESEVASLIRYRWSGWVPAVLREPRVALSGDTMRLGGRVATEILPSVPELDGVRELLPDTVDVEVAGQLEPLTPGRAAFDIATIEVEELPIPERYYLPMLERLGRRDEPGMPATALPLTLPDGVGSAHVDGGYLVLTP